MLSDPIYEQKGHFLSPKGKRNIQKIPNDNGNVVAVNDEDEYDEDDFPPLDQEDDQSGKKSDNASPDHLKFRSFLVTNRVPSTRKINHNEKPANQNSTSNLFTIKDRIKQTLLICQEAWFTLKKFEDFTNKP